MWEQPSIIKLLILKMVEGRISALAKSTLKTSKRITRATKNGTNLKHIKFPAFYIHCEKNCILQSLQWKFGY